MGECLISRRGGEAYKAPVLNASYPKDVTAVANATGTASFSISISEHGKPEAYSYQWYVNGKAVSGAVTSNYTTDLKAVGTKTIYCIVTNKAGSVTSRAATFIVQDPIPTDYTYTSNAKIVKEDNYNWRIEFYNSGKLVLPRNMDVDVYIHAAGGGGSNTGYNDAGGSGGGDGWLASHYGIKVTAGTTYDIVVGAGGSGGLPGHPDGYKGGSSSAFGYSVEGGNGGVYMGVGGTGYSGSGGNVWEGTGSSNTTYAFESSYGLLYGGCGGGCGWAGGQPYGGGGNNTLNAAANTGAGGGGRSHHDSETGARGGNGGSGIVIIRNAR